MIGAELAKESESQGETRSHQSHGSRDGEGHSVVLLRMTRKLKIEKSLFDLAAWRSCVTSMSTLCGVMG